MPRRSVEDPGEGDPLARIAVAFSHPLRVRIVRALVAGTGSATTLSKAFGDVNVGDLYYHLTVLERCRVVALCRLRPVRGAKERIFELRPRASWGDVWDSIPHPVAAGFQNAGLREFAALAAAALDSETVESRPATVMTGRSVKTDERGFVEIAELLRTALAGVDRVEGESRERLEAADADDEVTMVIGAAGFEAPPIDWWEARRPGSSEG